MAEMSTKRLQAHFAGKVTRVPVESDHSVLTHRDDPDQHPIKAITNLQGELDVRTDVAITNFEIDAILNS